MRNPALARRSSPRVILIGAGEGGPRALLAFFRALPHLDVPVVVVQRNMPAGFVAGLADLIARTSGHLCREAAGGEALYPGVVRMIPANLHGRIVQTPTGLRVELSAGEKINGSCPAVDPLFASAAGICGLHTVAVILGGKGRDGSDGADAVIAAGGTVLVEEPERSAYPDMPRHVLRRHVGLCRGAPAVLAKAAHHVALGDWLPPTRVARTAARANPSLPLVLIASSTGGPAALLEFFDALPDGFAAPIVIVQHMPPGLPARLAASLSETTGRKITQARGPTRLDPGTALIAPGDSHVKITAEGAGLAVNLDHAEAVDGNRPSADILFTSAAAAVGPRAVAVVLTGLGNDGLRGSQAIVARGGTVIVQDEASSVVWGMPGAVARAGLCTVQRRPGALAAWLATAAAKNFPITTAIHANDR